MCAKCLEQTDHHPERKILLALNFFQENKNQEPVDKLKYENLLGELKSQAHI